MSADDKTPGAKGQNTLNEDAPQGPFPLQQGEQERLAQLFREVCEAASAARKDFVEGRPVRTSPESEWVNLRTQLERMLAEFKRGGDTG
jgi:hypothetical protein